jgi:hypothetical protein
MLAIFSGLGNHEQTSCENSRKEEKIREENSAGKFKFLAVYKREEHTRATPLCRSR